MLENTLGTCVVTTGLATAGGATELCKNDDEGFVAYFGILSTLGSTVSTSVSMIKESADVIKLSQAVNYVETYNQEEINDLVNQIDLLLAENDVNVNNNQDVYVRSLKK